MVQYNDEEKIVNPIDRSADTAEKIRQLQELSKQNEPIVKDFLGEIDRKYGTESKTSHKEPEKIAQKATRPSITDLKQWYRVEHIRDSFRFKTVLNDIEDLPKIAEDLKDKGFEVIKSDTDKVLEPGPWGWRIAAFDLRMPNGQLVEYYLPVNEMEQAKKAGNHDLFEKWRSKDESKLTKTERQELFQARKASRQSYGKAWQDYLERTKQKPERIKEVLEKTERAFEKPKNKAIDKPPQQKKPSKLIQRLKEQKTRSKEDDLLR